MSDENMSSRIRDVAQKVYSIGLKAIKIQLKLNGTKFVVSRPKPNSKWKEVFGGSYSSDSTLENDYDHFTTTLIINKNEMVDFWNRNRDNVEAYTNDSSLQLGDELQYTRNGRTYRFKIVGKNSYSESADSIYVYTLSSIVETLDM